MSSRQYIYKEIKLAFFWSIFMFVFQGLSELKEKSFDEIFISSIALKRFLWWIFGGFIFAVISIYFDSKKEN